VIEGSVGGCLRDAVGRPGEGVTVTGDADPLGSSGESGHDVSHVDVSHVDGDSVVNIVFRVPKAASVSAFACGSPVARWDGIALSLTLVPVVLARTRLLRRFATPNQSGQFP